MVVDLGKRSGKKESLRQTFKKRNYNQALPRSIIQKEGDHVQYAQSELQMAREQEAKDPLGAADHYMEAGKQFDKAAFVRYDESNPGANNRHARKEYLESAKAFRRASELYGAAGKTESAEKAAEFARKNHDTYRGLLVNISRKKSSDAQEATRQRNRGLSQTVVTSLFFLVGIAGLFFLVPRLTGNAIANSMINRPSILGGILFFVGLVGIFYSLKK